MITMTDEELVRRAEMVIKGNINATVILSQNEGVALLSRIKAAEAELARLREAIQGLLAAACGPVGFAEAVRHNSGKAYPWPSLDAAEDSARAALAETEGE